LFSTPFQQALGALVLLYAIAASAWNIVGGYAGQVSVGHVVFFAAAPMLDGRVFAFRAAAAGRNSAGVVASVLIAAIIGVPTLRLVGPLLSAWRPSRWPNSSG